MNFNFFSKIFLQNLPSQKERLSLSLIEIEKIGITNLEIYGIEPEENENRNFNNFKNKYNIIKKAKENEYENILLLEDDFIFDDNIIQNLEGCIENLPEDWDLFYLTGFPSKNFTIYEENSRKGRFIVSDIENGFLEKYNMDSSIVLPIIPNDKDFIEKYNIYERISSNLIKVKKNGCIGYLQTVAFNSKFYDTFINKFENILKDGRMEEVDGWLASIQVRGMVNSYYACPVLAYHRPCISSRTGNYFGKDINENTLYNELLTFNT